MESNRIKYLTIFLLYFSAILYKPISAQNLKVHFIDVGQGDAILIQSGDQNYLIDSGPDREDNKLIQYLRNVGVDTIHAAMLATPEHHHLAEFEDLVESDIRIERFIMSVFGNRAHFFIHELYDFLQKHNIPVQEILKGVNLGWNNETEVLATAWSYGVPGTEALIAWG